MDSRYLRLTAFGVAAGLTLALFCAAGPAMAALFVWLGKHSSAELKMLQAGLSLATVLLLAIGIALQARRSRRDSKLPAERLGKVSPS